MDASRNAGRKAPGTGRAGARRARALAVAALVVASPALAGDPAPRDARDGAALAAEAATAWAPDAALVYLENDEAITPDGRAARWGYLFYSRSLDAARAYSIAEDEIVVARDPGMSFEAPPVSSGWIESGRALAAAEEAAGARYREERGGTLRTMLLMRGALDDQEPDRTTWMVIYVAPGAPSLFVVVDAATGKIGRRWEG